VLPVRQEIGGISVSFHGVGRRAASRNVISSSARPWRRPSPHLHRHGRTGDSRIKPRNQVLPAEKARRCSREFSFVAWMVGQLTGGGVRRPAGV